MLYIALEQDALWEGGGGVLTEQAEQAEQRLHATSDSVL